MAQPRPSPSAERAAQDGFPGFDPSAPYHELLQMNIPGLGLHDGRVEWSVRLTRLPVGIDQPLVLDHLWACKVVGCRIVHLPVVLPGEAACAFLRFYNWYNAHDAITFLRDVAFPGGGPPRIEWATPRAPPDLPALRPPAPPTEDPPAPRQLALGDIPPPPPPDGPPPDQRLPAPAAAAGAPPPPPQVVIPYKAPPPPPPQGLEAWPPPPAVTLDAAPGGAAPDYGGRDAGWQDGRPGNSCRLCFLAPLPEEVLWAARVHSHIEAFDPRPRVTPTDRRGRGSLDPDPHEVPICAPCCGALLILRRTANRPRGRAYQQQRTDNLWGALHRLPRDGY